MSGGGEVSGDSDETDDEVETRGEVEPAPVTDCPHCGEPVSFAVVTGPQNGTVEPCGCGLPSALLERIGGD